MRDAKSPLASHIEGFLAAKRLAPKTRVDYARYLAEFDRFTLGVSLEEALTIDNATGWLEEVRRRGVFGARNACMTLKSFATWIAKMRYIQIPGGGSLLAGLEGPQVPGTSRNSFSDEQLEAIWAALEERPNHDRVRAKAYLWLLFATGLRKNEARQLALADIHLDPVGTRSWVHVRWQTSKGSKERKVRLDRAALTAIEAYIADARPTYVGPRNKSEPLFLTTFGTGFTDYGFSTWAARIFDDIEKATGIKASSHVFRHTWATQYHRAMRDTGLTLYDMRDEGGWSGLEVPQRYTHSRPFEELLDHPTAISALQKRRMRDTG